MVPGAPKAKKSAAGRTTLYNPSKEDMRKWISIARSQVPDEQKKFRGPVKLNLKCFF